MPLIIPFAAMVLAIMLVMSLRLLRTTGLEDVEESFRAGFGASADGAAAKKDGLGRLLDTIGARFVGFAMRLYGPARLQRLETTIRRAGRPDGLTVIVYIRRQSAFIVIAMLLLVTFAIIGQPLIGAVFAIALCGWMRLWLVSAGSKRQAQIDTELPDFLDVLGVTVTAGLGFRQAVERVCEFHDGPLAQEMTTALREMAMGVSRRQAFIAMRDRTRSEAFGSFVTALLQAEELGVPLAGALNDIASDVRKDHAQSVRQAAAKAAPKVSLVVTMTIVPGALILIGSAIVLVNKDALSGIF